MLTCQLGFTVRCVSLQFSGRNLNLNDTILSDLESDCKDSIKEVRYQMLVKWQATNSAAAHVQVLFKALKDADRLDIATNIFGKLRDPPLSHYQSGE